MKQNIKIAAGCDPAAYNFYSRVIAELRRRGYDIDNVGCESSYQSGDCKYAEMAELVAEKVNSGEATVGFLMCGTGQGMAMASNKIPGIRAVLCYEVLPAVLSRNDNNGNVLCTGAWLMEPKGMEYTLSMIEAWLYSEYTGIHEQGMAFLRRLEQKAAATSAAEQE